MRAYSTNMLLAIFSTCLLILQTTNACADGSNLVQGTPPASASCDTARAPRPSLPAGIYLHDACAVTSNAAESTVTVRFYLEDIHGEPVAYLATTNFTVLHGVNCATLHGATNRFEGREGSIAVNKQGQRYFGSTIKIARTWPKSPGLAQHVAIFIIRPC